MNPILESLHTRKSVRVFTGQPISPEVRQAILLAAAQAPTAGNQQLYTVLDIDDPALKARLADTCDHQPFIATAPLVLVFCADPLKWRDAYAAAGCAPRPLGVGDLLLALADATIAAQNAVTAAWSLGVGSCYIGDILENVEEHRALLHLPDAVVPAAMLVLGYPTAQQQARPKPERAPLESIVQRNAYRRMDGAQLRAMLEPRVPAGQTYEAWLTAFWRRKYESDFSREMSRSAQVYLRAYPTLPDVGEEPDGNG